mmetsp:Transcript_18499/g.53520  ORF Transcript_18499/g.53520 Transcript_18499/m.53520 type:complete len:1202 (-) Transcript_18499:242-3847(-)|eukprot:CAMPEP_0176014512 /NCGR_PEP_ID=MMETSP0120_2-20121206/6863_1 /TAXON_ID=160619 /ORGANISM="Kryptoperidinium foliaceum, Strain CCMP 1326" /LENGTH=1201 /DNA_ID=CAMNT_0017347459 /DNA_START=91 /DNA_END=3696 /DNA_ORIENTATION=-
MEASEIAEPATGTAAVAADENQNSSEPPKAGETVRQNIQQDGDAPTPAKTTIASTTKPQEHAAEQKKTTDAGNTKDEKETEKKPPGRTRSGNLSTAAAGLSKANAVEGRPSAERRPSVADKSAPARDPSPLGVKIVQIPNSDTESVCSVASNLDSVGAATRAEQRMQTSAPKLQANTEPVADRANTTNANAIPQQVNTSGPTSPQQLQQQNVVSQSVLVAVPLQQSGTDMLQQQNGQDQGTNNNNTQYTAQPQETLVYQIPGVMTVPVGTQHEGQSNQVLHSTAQFHQLQPQTGILQQSIQTAGQQDVIGMVGTIPIVKLQGGTVHLVKKKKGRFKFLQETTAVPSTAAGTNTAAAPAPVPAPMAPPANQTSTPAAPPTAQGPVPTNISVPAPSQNQSIVSGVSQLSNPIAQAQNPADNAPKVKKKGRFVVTSVKDPVPLPKGNPPQNAGDGSQVGMPMQQQQPQVAQAQQWQNQQGPWVQQQLQFSPNVQMGQSTPQHQPYQQQMNMQGAPQEVIAHLSIPTTFEAQFLQPMVQQNMMQSDHQTMQFSNAMPGFVQQQAVQQPQANMQQQPMQSQQNPAAPGEHYPMQANAQPANFAAPVPNGAQPPAPMASGGKDSSPRSMAAQKPPPAQQPIPPKKPVVQKRPVKAPQSIGSNGMYGNANAGLGKLSYLLEQMKSEVTEADRMIKHLQTDMKILRDKNKELEAKNRDLERKCKEEVSLREKAEARCAEFRKRIRALNGDAANAGQDQMNSSQRARTQSTSSAPAKDTGIRNGTTEKSNIAKPPAAGPRKDMNQEGGAQRLQNPKQVLPPAAGDKAPGKQGGAGTGNKEPTKQTPEVAATIQSPATTPKKTAANPSEIHGETAVPKKATENAAQAKATPRPNENLVGAGTASMATGQNPTKVAANATSQLGTVSGEVAAATNAQESANTRKVRSNSGGSGQQEKDTNVKPPGLPTKIEIPTPSTPTIQRTVMNQHRPDHSAPHQATQGQPMQQRPPMVARAATTQGTSRASSINDFDPLRPAAATNMESGVFPVISFPTNVSLGAVPIGTTSSFCESHGENMTYSAATAPVSGENPYVFPIALGMAPAAGPGQPSQMGNGFQMQQPYVLQQPIMFQQVHGSVQEWPAHMQQHQQIPQTSNHQHFYNQGQPPMPQPHTIQQQQSVGQQQQTGLHQQQQQQQQQPQHQPQSSSNPFDPFGP